MYRKWQSYDVWFLRYRAWQTELFVILDYFFAFYTPKNLKNQNFEKMKRMPGDIIILLKCTKNHDHMHRSWDTMCDGSNSYFLFCNIFCPFTPLTTQKIKIFKKWKKVPGDIIILHMCTKNNYHMIIGSWNMVHNDWIDRQTDGKSDM